MKHNRNLILSALSVAVAVVAMSLQAQAQGKIVTVSKPIVQSQKTPDYNVQGPKKKRWTQKEWVEIEVPFQVNKLPAKQVALESLVFNYYVVVNGPEKKMLTASVTHTNVPGKQKIASVMYISPQTMQKIANSSKVSGPAKMVVAYGIEVEYGGQTVGFFDSTGAKKPEAAFWTKSKFDKMDGLLTKKETPFAPLWADYHAEVK